MFWKRARLKCSERGLALNDGSSAVDLYHERMDRFSSATADAVRASDLNGQHCCNTGGARHQWNSAGTGSLCRSAIGIRLPPSESPRSGFRPVSAGRVLVVDDDADSAELLGLLLNRVGWESRIVCKPDEAVATALEFLPDLALLDIGLPGIDGIELLGRLRAKEELGDCRFIAVTGYDFDHLEAQSQTARFDAYLQKPFNFEDLWRVAADTVMLEANGKR